MTRHHPFLRLSAVISSALAGIFLVNHGIAASAVSKNILDKNGEYFSWKTGKIFYRKSGTGDSPLLMIHNATETSSSYEWSRIEDHLKPFYTIYQIDLPGCGRSDKPGIVYTNYLYVQLITSFIKEVIGSNTIICASGLSSSFAVMAAYSDREIISGIYMINPYSLHSLSQAPDSISNTFFRFFLSMPVIGTMIYHMFTSRSNIDYKLKEEYFYNPFKADSKIENAFYEASHLQEGKGRFLLFSEKYNYLNWNIRRVLPSLMIPISIIIGEKMNTRTTIIKEYEEVCKNLDINIIPETKSLPHLEKPDMVSEILIAGML